MLPRLVDQLIRFRVSHLCIALLLSLASVLLLTGLTFKGKVILPGLVIDNSPEAWLSEDDPNLQGIRAFQQYFNTDEYFIVAFQDPNLFSVSALNELSQLSKDLKALPYVLSVTSLTEIKELRGNQDEISIKPYFNTSTQSQAEIAEAGKRAIANDRHRNQVVSVDGQTAGIVVRVIAQPGGVGYQRELKLKVHEMLAKASEHTQLRYHASGTTMLIGWEEEAAMQDSVLCMNLACLILIFTLYCLFRSLRLVR